MAFSAGKIGRIKRIAMLDILPVKPVVGWNDLQLDEALRRHELFHGNIELYAAVRREAIKRGLGGEEDFDPSPFGATDMENEQAGGQLPFLLDHERHAEKHERKERRKKLKRLLETMTMSERKEKKRGSLDRLLRLAETTGVNLALERQIALYLQRSIERTAHMVPSKETETPPMWRRNMDYSPDENSPYFGSVSDFLKKFPGGISEWRKWREKSRKQRERQWRIASLMPEAAADDDLDRFLKEAWAHEAEQSELDALAHFVPEGGDDVDKLGDKEPKIWSDGPEWESIGEFLEAHRDHYGQDANDAALKAARDFVRYWRLATKKPGGK